MELRTLGTSGPETSAIALGTMGMSDFYGSGRNEQLIARALKERDRDEVTISVKFGALRDPAGGWGPYDSRPAAVKNFLAYSLNRLGTDHLDVYRPARLDPQVPIEETVGAMAELVQAGYVRHIGLSEVGVETIRRAAAVHPISDLQIEYSLLSRGPEAEIIPALRELGIGLTAASPLSRGLLSGHWNPQRELTAHDFRTFSPRFQGENLEHNLALVERLRVIAEEREASVAQVAIAWVLSRGDDIVPLVGARSRERLHEALWAADLELLPADLDRIEQALPAGAAAGTRYADFLMGQLDSEKSTA